MIGVLKTIFEADPENNDLVSIKYDFNTLYQVHLVWSLSQLLREKTGLGQDFWNVVHVLGTFLGKFNAFPNVPFTTVLCCFISLKQLSLFLKSHPKHMLGFRQSDK